MPEDVGVGASAGEDAADTAVCFAGAAPVAKVGNAGGKPLSYIARQTQ